MPSNPNREPAVRNRGPKRIVKVWLPPSVAAKLEAEGIPLGMGLSGIIRMLCMTHVKGQR